MPAGRLALIVSAVTLVGLGLCRLPAQAETKQLVVEAGKAERAWVPMCVALPEGTTKAKLLDAGKEVPSQVAEGMLWWVLERLPAGEAKTYTVELGSAPAAKPDGVALKQTEKAIDITIAGKPFATYRFTLEKSCGQQLRRPCFFPVYGPEQTLMTRPYPLTDKVEIKQATDHPHHTSIWVAHGDVNGVDNWSISGKAGWQVHKSFEAVASGAVMGMFRETLDWTDAARKPVMAEVRTARVYALPDTHRMLDLEIRFQAKYGPVKFGDTKEGGLCATRTRPEMRADRKFGKDGRLVNAEGQTAGGAWGKKAAWVDASGTVDGRRVGFALFDAPGNLRHPTTWHARTYGLLTANPFGLSHFTGKKERGDHTLGADQELTFRYRVYFHVGDEKAAKVAERFADYAAPPKAEWK